MTDIQGDIIETGVNWDHDTGEIVVSTRRNSIKSKLLKIGLRPVRDEANGYTTFKASEKDLKLSFRAPKKLSDEQRRAIGRRLAKNRKSA